MASFTRAKAEIHYDEAGSGFPILLIAPGGMKSAAEKWATTPWNPIDQLAQYYRVIAMDQRNAGRSVGPISGDDGWHTYTEDQLALMEHLGIDRFHVVGMCIGGAYGFGLTQAAPDRIASVTMFQPIGREDNEAAFFDVFDVWAAEISNSHPDVTDDDWASFRHNMYGGDDLVFTIAEDDLAHVSTPILVLMGNDLYHPESTSRTIAASCPNASLVESWKDPADHPAARSAIETFLAAHTDG